MNEEQTETLKRLVDIARMANTLAALDPHAMMGQLQIIAIQGAFKVIAPMALAKAEEHLPLT